ncbi:hypothetical protein KKA01_02765 [Patescibacteria group bacterium]|nr:hypothetical protein [Patescibacteria group bacterium]
MNIKKPPFVIVYIILFALGIFIIFFGAYKYAQDSLYLIPSFIAFTIISLLGVTKLIYAKTKKHKILLWVFIILFNPVSGAIFIPALSDTFDDNESYLYSTENLNFLNLSNSQVVQQKVSAENAIVNEIVESKLPLLSKNTKLINRYQVESNNNEAYIIWLYTREEATKDELTDVGTQMAEALTEKNPGYYYTFFVFPDTSVKQVGDTLPYDSYQTFYWKDNEIVFGVN